MSRQPTPSPIEVVSGQQLTAESRERLEPICRVIGGVEFVGDVLDSFQSWEAREYEHERALGTGNNSVFGELVDRYTEDEEQTQALVELGAAFRDADRETTHMVGYRLGRDGERKRERTLSRAIKRAKQVVADLPELSFDEIREAGNASKALRPNTDRFAERLDDPSNTITLGEIRDQSTAIDHHRQNMLTEAETNLLTGVAVLQVIALFETPEMQTACERDSYFFSNEEMAGVFTGPTERALSILGDLKDPDEKEGIALAHDIIAGLVEQYPQPRRMFGRQKQTAILHGQIARMVFLPGLISAVRADGVSINSRERELMTPILQRELRASGAAILRQTTELVDDIGERVAEADELMLEALVIDAFKDRVVAFVLERTLGTGRDAAYREAIHDGVTKLSEFSLHAALSPEQSQLDEKTHLREVYATLKALAEERDERYSMSNSQLRKQDPNWRFLTTVLNTSKDIHDKAHAKAVCKFMLALASLPSSQPGRRDIFDQLLLDMDAELHDNKTLHALPISIRGNNGRGTHFEPQASWLFAQAERIRRIQGVPSVVSSMLDDLVTYKHALAGQQTGLEAIGDDDIVEPPTELSDPEPETPEIDPLDELLGVDFVDLADQLDWVVFPEGAGLGVIKRMLEGRVDTSRVNWDRLQHLVDLTDRFDGRIYISRDRDALGTSVPYLVAEFDMQERRFAVAECPEIGNATYIVCNEQAVGTWQELMRLSRGEARELGAKRVIHPNEENHIQRIVNKLNTMLVAKV